MSLRNLDKIFRPRRIALIGAGSEPGSPGLAVLDNLLRGGFAGGIYPIDAEHEAIHGIPTFADLDHLPHPADLALIFSPAADVPDEVERCGEAGIRGIVIFAPGFREAGPAGAALERRIGEIAARFGDLTIIGPNSLGVIAPPAGLNASQAVTQPAAGHLAFISQSRALCNAIIGWASEQGIGFSCFVSIGNMLDVGFGDLIDYLSRDPHTRAIILYLQSIGDARHFMSAARAFARTKPIVAYKAGRFGESAKAAASHTGRMVAEDAVYGAAFERAGIVRVDELDDVFDVAELLTSKRLPKGPRLAIVSNAGGPAIIAADGLLARGGILAALDDDTLARLAALLPGAAHANPIDLRDDATAERYADALDIVLGDRNVDAALVIFAAQSGTSALATAEAVTGAAERSHKPVLAAWMGGQDVRPGVRHLNEQGLATHSTPEQAVRAFMHLVSYARNLESLYETPRAGPLRFALNRRKLHRKLGPVLRSKTSDLLSEAAAQSMLRAYQIPVVEGVVARSGEDAVSIAERIGYPVALKIVAPQVLHKVDVGGVSLDLAGPHAVRAAFTQLMANARRNHLGAVGVSVQRMVKEPDSVELILGAKKDATFGAVVMVGSGGVAADVVSDRALGLPPLNERLTRRMLESLRLWPILQGYRGLPAVDVDRLIEAIIRFSCLIIDYPEIREFEINPLLVTPREVVALDAAAIIDNRVGPLPRGRHPHLAIRPYPEEYLHRARLKDGSPVVLRSVRPEDESGWHALIAGSSADSLRLRFRSPFKQSTHQMAVDQVFIDYEREIGIVAEIEADGATALVGFARLLADTAEEVAEFAVIVVDAWQGRGLGGILLDYCLDLARRRGFKRVVAETDPDNLPMLALFRSRGFATRVHREEDVVYVEKALAPRNAPHRPVARRRRPAPVEG